MMLRQAVASISKHVDALAGHDVASAINAARVAAHYAKSGSALEQQAVAVTLRLLKTDLPEPRSPDSNAGAIAAFMQRFGSTAAPALGA